VKLTDEQKRWLAEELCELERIWRAGEQVEDEYIHAYINKRLEFVCFHDDFDPLNNWNHLRLIWEELIRRKNVGQGARLATAQVLTKLANRISEGMGPFELQDYILSAALALKEKK
jgi:hypothetical protein